MIQKGGNQPAGEDPGVGIAYQILTPGDADANPVAVKAVVDEAKGMGMGCPGRQLWEYVENR